MKIEYDIDLSKWSNWKVGGIANCLITINSSDDYVLALDYAKKHALKPVIIGNTTNLLFDNERLNIALIKLSDNFNDVVFKSESILVGANNFCPFLSRKAQKQGVSGLEHIIGIPATIGGLVYMNGGSKRKTISENIIAVTSINNKGKIIRRKRDECCFSYRKSIFQSLNELIISVELSISIESKDIIRKECLNILKDRREKFPRKEPSCGSVFISNPVMYDKIGPPGKIIENLGFKGMSIGGAEVSSHHANFIVNKNFAKAGDILALVDSINNKVFEHYGFKLKSEGIFVSKSGTLLTLDKTPCVISHEK